MSLLALMYHRAVAGRYGNPEQTLDAHFRRLSQAARCVTPGDTIEPGCLNVCITFDDAYYDFYAIVLPLLEKHGLRAQLAVCPGLVAERCTRSREERLGVPTTEALAHPHNGALCTWDELTVLAASGRVSFAAHGWSHAALDHPAVDLQREIVDSGAVLRQRLAVPVASFVFPYGRFNASARELASGHYGHLWRIGQAVNRDWNQPMLYRVGADETGSLDPLFGPVRQIQYRCNALWNAMRGR
jgi:peptidoglycan/xylan/chitin deacetylase (PgdA/CDA1 family)